MAFVTAVRGGAVEGAPLRWRGTRGACGEVGGYAGGVVAHVDWETCSGRMSNDSYFLCV